MPVRANRATNLKSRDSRRPKKPTPEFPANALAALFRTGVGEINGIKFDLSGFNLLHDGWRPVTMPYHSDPFVEVGGLVFPWNSGRRKPNIRHGDLITIDSTTTEKWATEFDYRSDQGVQLVQYAVFRNGRKLALDLDYAEYSQPDAFLFVVDFERAVQRIKSLVHADHFKALAARVGETGDPIAYQMLENDAAESARKLRSGRSGHHQARALEAAHAVNAIWATLVTKVRQSGLANSSTGPIFSAAKDAIDISVACGYWLAKAEFEVHVDEAKYARKRKAAYQETGKKTGQAARDKADAKWATEFLAKCRELRKKYPSYGQKRIADLAESALPHIDLPLRETLVAKIGYWEKEGRLERSTRNLAKGGSGSL